MSSSAAPVQPVAERYSVLPLWLTRRSRREISAGAVQVYAYLRSRYNELYGYAWPSIDTIAADNGVCSRTVNRALSELRKLKLIEVARRGKCLTNGYRFPDHPWMAERRLEAVPDPEESDATTLSPSSASDATSGVVSMKTYSDEEPMGTTAPAVQAGRRGVRGLPPEMPSDDDYAETIGAVDDPPEPAPPRPPRLRGRRPARPADAPTARRAAPNTRWQPSSDDPDEWNAGNLAWYFGQQMLQLAARQEIVGFAGWGNEEIVAREIKKWLDAGRLGSDVKAAIDYFAGNASFYLQEGIKPARTFLAQAPRIFAKAAAKQTNDLGYVNPYKQEIPWKR